MMSDKNIRLKRYIGVALAIIGVAALTKSAIGGILIIVSGLLCVIYNKKNSIYIIASILAFGIIFAVLEKPAYIGKFKHCEKNVCEIVVIDKKYFHLFDGTKYEYKTTRKDGLNYIDVGSTYTFSYDRNTDELCYVGNSECMYKFERYID